MEDGVKLAALRMMQEKILEQFNAGGWSESHEHANAFANLVMAEVRLLQHYPGLNYPELKEQPLPTPSTEPWSLNPKDRPFKPFG